MRKIGNDQEENLLRLNSIEIIRSFSFRGLKKENIKKIALPLKYIQWTGMRHERSKHKDNPERKCPCCCRKWLLSQLLKFATLPHSLRDYYRHKKYKTCNPKSHKKVHDNIIVWHYEKCLVNLLSGVERGELIERGDFVRKVK